MALTSATYDVQGVQPEVIIIPGRITGETTGPTVGALIGKKFSVAYSATGIYTVTLTDPLGSIISVVSSLSATTPGDVKGHTVIAEALTTSTFKFNVYNASDTAHALVDLEWINFIIVGTNSSLD